MPLRLPERLILPDDSDGRDFLVDFLAEELDTELDLVKDCRLSVVPLERLPAMLGAGDEEGAGTFREGET